ncbi:Retrovirus-related Pol polyprotein LINE-1 [Gossypium australe]|uniref:Retrovirus-related Pol polyprotein LINE-1 n=1 Tax=Gossypium australe TaxID=47621 RepID=A0A5B6V8Y6_9ROSI|nr:Retrovirus-related Pol polyprotein LINE-1 [Gossypium australe]
MKSKQKNKRWMAIKIDLEKAYDRVRWDFIDASLQALGVDEDIQRRISGFYGFQVVQNIGLYLGVSLFHEKVTNNTLRFVVDKMRSKLCSWDARQLFLAGKITLAQAVLLSIRSYFMQSMLIPKGLCDEIEALVKQFIWGSTSGNKKIALVSWDSICQPKSHDGIGIRTLRDHNTYFIMKLGFKLVTDYSSLWVNVIWSKYGFKMGYRSFYREDVFFLVEIFVKDLAAHTREFALVCWRWAKY